MTHLDVIGSLSSPDKQVLTTRSNRAGLKHLFGHMSALAVTGTYIAVQAPFWGIFLFPHGVLLVFLFTLSHECTHQTPFRSPWLNDVVGHVTAPILALPFVWFRYFHLAHHRFTNDPERDPELVGEGRPDTWRTYLIYLSGWGYWRGNAVTLVQNAMGRCDAPYLPQRKHTAIQREAQVILCVYAVALASLFFSTALIWLWLVPMIIAQPVLRLYLLAEHGHCPPVADMLENTRTTFTSRLVRWLAWNMPYHIEHHSFPSVPFHHLPALHTHMRPHLKSTSDGYHAFTKGYVKKLER